MKATVRVKLFALLLAFGLIAIGATYVMASWAFSTGFLRFVEGKKALETELLISRLAQIHGEEGGWQALAGSDARWNAVHKQAKNAAAGKPYTSPLPQPGQGDRPALGRRYVLLNAAKVPLIGTPDPPWRMTLKPIKRDGKVIGYLGVRDPRLAEDGPVEHFVEGLLETFGLMALALGLFGAVIAWLLASRVTRPLAEFAKASEQLAEGRLDVRMPMTSRDEFGDMSAHFNLMADRLCEMERLRKVWLAEVSHDLRTPLASLKARLEAMQDGVTACDPGSLGALQRSLQTLTGQIDELSRQASLAPASEDMPRAPVDLRRLLQDQYQGWATAFADAGLELQCQVPPTPCMLNGNELLLGRLLENLLSNSLRYTDPGGRVILSLTRREDGWNVSLEDSAPGWDGPDPERMFERFVRADTARSRHQQGEGLGLAICRQIAAMHGATLRAEPSALGGVAIHLALPKGELQ